MQIKNLSAFYGKKQILNGLDFTLERGKFTALLGKNGSGKSTLLKCINGQVRYDGEILLGDQPLKDCSPREKARKIAYLPQFLPRSALTAEELIALGRNPHLGLSGKLQTEDREQIERAIVLTDTQALRHRLLASLSGGERQKVYLAMLLAQDAEIFLLDEPTAHMDMDFTSEFLSLLRRLTEEEGKTVLAVLHNLNDAVTYAHRLLLMNKGRLEDPAQIESVFGVQKIFYSKTEYFYK